MSIVCAGLMAYLAERAEFPDKLYSSVVQVLCENYTIHSRFTIMINAT